MHIFYTKGGIKQLHFSNMSKNLEPSPTFVDIVTKVGGFCFVSMAILGVLKEKNMYFFVYF